jgi:hypothetical protein
MLFPNFYVPSVGVEFVTDFFGTRMSLSHLGGREQGFGQIYRRLIPATHAANKI